MPLYWYPKANNKYMKNYDKKKNRHIFNIGMEIVHIIGQCHKTLRRPKILLKSMKIS